MPNWKKLIVSGSDASLNTLFVRNAISASIVSASSGITGSLFGTASWAVRAVTSSISINSNNILVEDADGAVWGGGAVPILFGGTAPAYPATYQGVYGDTELTYNPGTNTLVLAASTTQSFGNTTLLSMGNSSRFTMADTALVNIGNASAGKYANVFISGSTNLYRSGSNILAVSGSNGTIFAIDDSSPGSNTMLEVVSGSNVIFQVDAPAETSISGSFNLKGLGTYNHTNVLVIDISSGQVGYTASSAIGGGGSSTNMKAGSASAASFNGTPRTASISFGSAYSNNNYSVTITGEDARSWTIQSKTSAGFTINSNSSVALTGPAYWIASSWQ